MSSSFSSPRWQWLLERDEVVATRRVEASPGQRAEWPEWLGEETVARIQADGVPAPWRHQVELAEHAYAGRHAAICTPTGSGKSLAYLMPVLAATVDGRLGGKADPAERRSVGSRHTALYLSPTKALAHDQVRAARPLGPRNWWITALDGDSDTAERRFARDHASLIFTNPDLLHYSMLPNHRRWASFLGGLRYVIVDEAHRYQGIFGAHVAQVIRRLRRIAAQYGAHPAFVLSSATAPNASEFGGRLIGESSVEVVGQNTAPSPARTVALWQPTDSLNSDAAVLLAGLTDDDAQTLAFVASRIGAELVSSHAQDRAAEPTRIASYRAGYLALDRRSLEAQLQDRRLLGVATTNALELGVDISGVDAVLVAGYPGKLSSLWQQFGRAGRGGQEALAVLLARENPLDAYLLEHPELIFDAPVEHAVVHPDNHFVLGPHLAAAAQELPLSAADEYWFGPTFPALVAELSRQRVLRDRGGRYFWTRPDRAVDYISLRSPGPKPLDIVERDTGRVIGVIDHEAADRTVHPGAVYLHQGESYLVEECSYPENQALVVPGRPRYYTQAQSSFEIAVDRERDSRAFGATMVHRGDVTLTSQVVGYLRRDEVTNEVWDSTPLEMPQRRLATEAVWWSVPWEVSARIGWPDLRVGAALHAMEHAAIGLLPVFAPCDRWDIGGVSTPIHPDTGLPTVFVHDALAGGAGFARRGFDVVEQWLLATLEVLQRCRCEEGCPACVVSPKCGNANQVLNKADATMLLTLLLDG
ncbi:DEAD/DEAH box helicase [Tessaracoccus caeni]|uniref:DEAD/DEAH box helicase n=1 Tax=Tessaracoccus caeni TaxID=3031239 RepID=UPI0023DA6BA1|nr:DEAD/DEAH box helicase [Tessaracoccus caeni]MDF1487676.1 DEAD/DEAH box helicase [Tessaracoccus caeni]